MCNFHLVMNHRLASLLISTAKQLMRLDSTLMFHLKTTGIQLFRETLMESHGTRRLQFRKSKLIGRTFQMLLVKTTQSEITSFRHHDSKTSGKPHQHQTSSLDSGWKVYCNSKNLQKKNVISTNVQDFSVSNPNPCHKSWVKTKTLHILSRKVAKSVTLCPQWWVPNKLPLTQ